MPIELNAGVIEAVRAFMTAIPFNRLLGIELVELAAGFARIRTPFREELIGDHTRGVLHGGLIATVIDVAGGAAVWTGTELGDSLSTVDMRVDFLRPGRPVDLWVDARVVRIGNRVGVADMSAYQEGHLEAPIATGKGVYNVRRRRPRTEASG